MGVNEQRLLLPFGIAARHDRTLIDLLLTEPRVSYRVGLLTKDYVYLELPSVHALSLPILESAPAVVGVVVSRVPQSSVYCLSRVPTQISDPNNINVSQPPTMHPLS